VVELMPPLLYPMVYDDIECPCVFELKGRYYIIGSIREDIKIRYWFSPEFFGEYHSFHADVLLPRGNYAARIVRDGDHVLLYNFFYSFGKIDALRVLPPPKELDADSRGRLVLKSYYRWDKQVVETMLQADFGEVKHLLSNPTATSAIESDKWTCSSRSGYEIFSFKKPSSSFIWEGLLTVEGMGKLGLVTDIDVDGNGYFISFDVQNGLLQMRAWGFNPLDVRQNFVFNELQIGVFKMNEENKFNFRLIHYGNYIELSIDGEVKLTLMDYAFSGNGIGLYSASSVISLQNSIVKILPEPIDEYASQEDAHKIIDQTIAPL
jgi:beta-fructofuranosidase